MDEGYRKIFWGIFFSTFHINLGPLQILPAFIGWLMVANGINYLYEVHKNDSFRKATRYALLTSLVSGLGLLLTFYPVGYDIVEFWPIVFAIIELIMIYYLFKGSIESFHSSGDESTARDYTGRQSRFMIVYIIITIFECIGLTFKDVGMLTIVAIAAFLQVIWFMGTMSGLKKLYMEDEPVVGQDVNTEDVMENQEELQDGEWEEVQNEIKDEDQDED